jgi:hypothetical protein
MGRAEGPPELGDPDVVLEWDAGDGNAVDDQGRPTRADHHGPDVLGSVEAAAVTVDPERRVGGLPASLDLVLGG